MNDLSNINNLNIWAVFLTGLTTGGLSCVALQGGLLAGVIANQKERELTEAGSGKKADLKPMSFDQLDWLPVVIFLSTKLIAHIVLGFFLGWLGSRLELSLTMRLVFQGIAAIFMLAAAANLLDLHPIFRYMVLQPPRWVRRLLRDQARSQALFTPALLGVLTVLVPCGVTQSMEVLAITSANPIQGAAIMGAFVLGTSPIFAIVGVATAKLSETFKDRFLKIAAALLIFLGLSSFNGILTVLDAPITWQKATRPITYFFSDERFQQAANGDTGAVVDSQANVQYVGITVGNNGYYPKKVKVKAGIPVQLTLKSNKSYSCANWFTLPEFEIQAQLDPTDSQTFTFTPTKPGQYTYTCSMGMYSGVLEVVK
jgi:sulfite exporter TauE/SafE/plastocyanin